MQLFKKISVIVLSVMLVVLPTAIWLNRQDIIDYVRLRNYVPGPGIEAIAERTTMNEVGRKLFYVYYPVLQDRSEFNNSCTVEELSIVLGCYVERTGIYLFDVDDPRLAGVEEVTAAHEMLHVAYERLSNDERQRIDTLTQQAYEQVKNKRITSAVEAYRDRDPSIVPNELHSIIGTEVRSIPEELESYYQRYFSDRLAVVGFAEQYESVFNEREEKIAEYDERLAELRINIDRLQASSSSISGQITAERARLDSLIENNRVDEYNAAVPGFNSLVRSYNAGIEELRGYIDEYNAIVEQRNAIVIEERELVDAIDSRPNTIPTE